MPLVTVALVEGRSSEQKSALAKRICEAMKDEMGVPPEHIWIRYEDVAADDWFMGQQSIAEKRAKRE